MKSETKIFLDKKDDLERVISYVEEISTEEIIINFPRNSQVGMSVAHFKTLKKTAEKLGKRILIESVDDIVLDLAKEADIEAVNPVLRIKEKITDIVAKRKNINDADTEEEDNPEEESKEKPTVYFNHILRFTGVAIILGILGWGIFELTTEILPKATITLTLEKKTVPFEETIEIWSKATQVDLLTESKITIPGELFTARKNLEMKFAATGKKIIETQAKGVLTIYNGYDTKPQILVAKTRFKTPDGKIFRLDNQITVPGANSPAGEEKNGKLVPSSVEAAVTAAEAGSEYNLPLIALWRIPGFEGTTRYEGFYAGSKTPMSGGFKGATAGFTEADLEKAKTEVSKTLEDVLKSQMIVALKTNFKLLDNASLFKTTKMEPQLSESDEKSFSVWGEGEMKQLIFDEAMLKKALTDKAKQSVGDGFRLKEMNMQYGEIKSIILDEGKLDFKISGVAVFEADVNVAEWQEKILNANEKSFREIVFSFDGLEKANLVFWPFWVQKIPDNPSKIEIITQ